ncbi:MAG: helix-turn-helix transcriptional regulator [Sandaracinus sp.]|nr:helix-turn-helix transcriptional regulator [Myxococcales bacterium]MCB9601690.1 helix-turn-helix transcriptional regulator [Sandaracinus sp.]MCB9636040.1 helix-turn-helix transcriptional regulator [Sandaracinus sp.]
MQVTQDFGRMLKRYRGDRGLSQERLADHAEVSTRHLSFLENGRSSPSREMVLVLASALELPLRDRNHLLHAAGFAPVYAQASLDDRTFEPIRRALDHLLRAHEPFGAVVVDRDYDLVRANVGATKLLAWAFEGLTPPPEAMRNLLRATLDPRALASRLVNHAEIARELTTRLRHEHALELDPARRARFESLLELTRDIPSSRHDGPTLPVLPVHLRKDGVDLRLFTTLTTLGTPLDVTAQELRIESYFPADEASERLLRDL